MRRIAVLTALHLALVAQAAFAALAPTTPSYQLKWGMYGSGSAQFSGPEAVTTDQYGNVYVVDSVNHRIQKFGPNGGFLMKFGSSGTGPGQFSYPYSCAVAPNGDIYVVDTVNQRIQKFTDAGAFITQWGSAGSGNGQFNYPGGIALDRTGNVYIVDCANQRIQKFTSTGGFITKWGTNGTGDGQFQGAQDIAIDPSGYLYVSDVTLSRIQKFTSTGTFVMKWGGAGSGNGQLANPYFLAADALGNIYVSELSNHRVQKFTSAGTYVAQWGTLGAANGQFTSPTGVCADASGNFYVAETGGNRIQKFSGAGAAVSSPAYRYGFKFALGSPVTVACLNSLIYVTSGGLIKIYDFAGTMVGTLGSPSDPVPPNSPIGIAGFGPNAYILDTIAMKVIWYVSGVWAGTIGAGPGSGPGQFNIAKGVATNSVGEIYVADTGNNRIQKFSAAGVYQSEWGTLGSGAGQFDHPARLTVDAADFVYVADIVNNRIQKFTSSGMFVLQWGSLGSGDGQFNYPVAITTDAAGFVYVADYLNHRIQKFTSAGEYVAKWGSSGYGDGQTQYPECIAVDATGGVYVSSPVRGDIQKFFAAPTVAQVVDVGNDEGRQTMLRVLRDAADSPGSGSTAISSYEVYRRNEAPPNAATEAWPVGAASPEGTTLAGWTYLTTFPAHGESEYNVVAPTLADASAASTYYTQFMVRAATATPLIYFDSATENGWSIDNLPPATPAPFQAAYAGGATHLHWGVSAAADFATFRLYKGADPAFIPSAGSLVTATPDTGYTDAGAAGSTYKLTAVDRNGNESVWAIVSPNGTLDAPSVARPGTIELAGASPNPVGVGGLFRFALPRAMPVTLALFDLSGRHIRALAWGERAAGAHAVPWDGLDNNGHRVASGVFVLRLTAGGETRNKRVVTLD